MKNIKINALANLLVKILNIAFPLITNPYLTRILDETYYGNFNKVNTIVNIFIPFAAFGIYNYGIRAVSKVKEDKNEVNLIFSKLFYVSIITATFTTLIYLSFTLFTTNSYELTSLYYILGFQILFQFLYVEWVNEALENYTFILYKTLFLRIGMLISIFIFVKQETDIIPYSIIMSIITILNFIASFIWIKKDIKLVKVNVKELFILIKALLAMLLMANTNMLYTSLDRLFLSNSPHVVYVTYYVLAQSIIMLIADVIGGTVSVAIPRLGYYLGKKDKVSYENLVNKGSSIFYFFIIPISFGLIILGPYATLIYAGEKYVAAGIVTSIFAIRTIVWAIELILGKQIIFVNDYENKLILFYFSGGVVNIILNFLLFFNTIFSPSYYIITTIISEIIVVILEIIFIKKYNLISLKNIFKSIIKYCLVSLGFFPIYFIITNIYKSDLILNIITIKIVLSTTIISILYYAISLYLLKDSILFSIVEFAKKKLKG